MIRSSTRPDAWASERPTSVSSVAQWRASLAASLTEVDVNSQDAVPFGGQTREVHSGDMVLVQASASPHVVARTAAAVIGSTRPCFLLVAQSHDAWHIRQGPAMLSLRPGDVVLLDLAKPLELHFPRGCACLYVRVSNAWVGRWLTGDRVVGPRVAWRDKGWGMTLSALFRQLAEDPGAAEQYRGVALSDHLGAMLSAALEPADPTDGATGMPELLPLALAHMSANIDLPGLCAAAVADALKVSVRSLHRGFAGSDQPFAATLRRMRMQRAADLLRTPQLRGLSVAQIGARCGFPDPAHFGRAFQREHGTSPAAWRRASAGQAPAGAG